MGLCVSTNHSPAVDEASIELEKELFRQRLEALFNFKILLLGAGESGKSTVLKQLKLIHNKKLQAKDLVNVGDSLHQNVVDCMKALLYAAQKFEYELDDETDKKTAELIMNYDEAHRISYELGQAVLKLYKSKAIKDTYGRRSEYWILDACNYYMKNLERFTEIGFTPTEEDAVMARIRTTGIVPIDLEQKIQKVSEDDPDSLKFTVVDVGGQRNERKKWMHCFSDVKCILFVVNLAGYNQVLFEDNTKNRMQEALELFADITKRATFRDTPMFLFLNKKDLFEDEIRTVDLSHAFPDYTGGSNLQASLEHVEDAFRKKLPPGKSVDIQVVTSVVKRDIKYAFEEVKNKLYEMNRKQIEDEKKKIKKDEKQVTGKSKKSARV